MDGYRTGWIPVRQVLRLVAALALASAVPAAGLVVAPGDWLVTVAAPTAGSEPQASWSRSLTLTVTALGAWTLRASRLDAEWDTLNLALALELASAGEGLGTVTEISGPITVEATASDFLRGAQDRTGLVVTETITGISSALPPGHYSTEIELTLQDD